MKNYKYILFDLDGTLTDPGIGITNSIMYSLDKYGISVNDRSELYKFIGPPLLSSFEKFYNFSKEEAVKAVAYYREYYKDEGIFQNRVYDGIEQLLKRLRDSGKILLVATSKPEIFARRIIEHFGLSKYFAFVGGSIPDGTRTEKHEVIEYVLSEANVADRSQAIMVGDREFDVIGAKKSGLDCIGVLYGYGDKDELKNAGAKYIVESVEAVGDLILER